MKTVQRYSFEEAYNQGRGIYADNEGEYITYADHLECHPKCLCYIFNVEDGAGGITIDKDCPFHGSLLNTKNSEKELAL